MKGLEVSVKHVELGIGQLLIHGLSFLIQCLGIFHDILLLESALKLFLHYLLPHL